MPLLFNSLGSWKIPLSEVKVIGEYSTGRGRFGQDWFLVFVTGIEPAPYKASMYAENMREARGEIAESLGDLPWELKPSQMRSSRVIWPALLRDQALFNFGIGGFLQKLFAYFGVGKHESVHSAVVHEYLRQCAR
jgi:hypothetical protein